MSSPRRRTSPLSTGYRLSEDPYGHEVPRQSHRKVHEDVNVISRTLRNENDLLRYQLNDIIAREKNQVRFETGYSSEGFYLPSACRTNKRWCPHCACSDKMESFQKFVQVKVIAKDGMDPVQGEPLKRKFPKSQAVKNSNKNFQMH